MTRGPHGLDWDCHKQAEFKESITEQERAEFGWNSKAEFAIEVRNLKRRIAGLEVELQAARRAQSGEQAQTRESVIQHLTNAGVLEHDGCGMFIASGLASELVDACMTLPLAVHPAPALEVERDALRLLADRKWTISQEGRIVTVLDGEKVVCTAIDDGSMSRVDLLCAAIRAASQPNGEV